MRTNTIDLTADALLLRSANGGVTVSIPIRIRRYGGRKQVVVPKGLSNDLNATAAPTALQVALARGHRWLRQIESGKVTNISAIAKAENVDRSYISRMVNLTTLAPESQVAITRLCQIRCRCSTWPATRRCLGRSSGQGSPTHL